MELALGLILEYVLFHIKDNLFCIVILFGKFDHFLKTFRSRRSRSDNSLHNNFVIIEIENE